LEGIFGANDFAFEVGCEGGVVCCETFDAKIATEERLCHVNIFNLDLHVILLSI